jgi:hypothetical protein
MAKPDRKISSKDIPAPSATINGQQSNVPRGMQHDYQSNNLDTKSSSIVGESQGQLRAYHSLELGVGSSMRSLQLLCQIVFQMIKYVRLVEIDGRCCPSMTLTNRTQSSSSWLSLRRFLVATSSRAFLSHQHSPVEHMVNLQDIYKRNRGIRELLIRPLLYVEFILIQYRFGSILI